MLMFVTRMRSTAYVIMKVIYICSQSMLKVHKFDYKCTQTDFTVFSTHMFLLHLLCLLKYGKNAR